MIEVREIGTPEDMQALGEEWRSLASRTEDATPFQTFEWHSAWLSHLGAPRGVRLHLLTARDGGELIGLLPLAGTRYRGTPLRQLRFATAPLADYQDLVGPLARRDACRDAFLAHLAGGRDGFDFLDLNDLREGSSLTRDLPVGPPLTGALEFHRVCPYLALPARFDDLVAGLGRNLRASVRRRRRQLEKKFRLELSRPTRAELPAAMEELFELHNRRWRKRGAAGAFSDPAVQRFHQDLAARFDERGWLRLHRLRLDGVTRAAFYCFHLGSRTYYYLSGFDLDYARHSVGTVLMAHAVKSAIEEGDVEFDLLRGDETYKLAWKALERRTFRLIVGHGAVRSRGGLAAHAMERFLERRGLALQRWLWGRKERRAPTAPADEEAAT